MQLSLKRKGDYAEVRAMISIGRHHGAGLRQARQISTEMHISYKTLTLILAGLVAEGLLEATHGPHGGYRLARPPSDISLLDIVEAAEGPATFDHCVLRDGPCDWDDTCPVHDTWARTRTRPHPRVGFNFPRRNSCNRRRHPSRFIPARDPSPRPVHGSTRHPQLADCHSSIDHQIGYNLWPTHWLDATAEDDG